MSEKWAEIEDYGDRIFGLSFSDDDIITSVDELGTPIVLVRKSAVESKLQAEKESTCQST